MTSHISHRLVALTFAAATLIPAVAGAGQASGPDVTVLFLTGVSNWTNVAGIGGERAYSIGTTSCNQGDQQLNWCDEFGGCGGGTTASDHPVIAQNVYRLKNGRFEQIGMSWLKHGFTALQQSFPGCNGGTCIPAGTGDRLGVGCSDPYTSGLNGGRSNLGPRSLVQPATGTFPPQSDTPFSTDLDQRLRIFEADMTAGAGERYFGEAQYIAPDDAQVGNGLNNASYRELSLGLPGFNLSFPGANPTFDEQPAINAWQAADAAVELVNVDIPGSSPVERFQIARKVTDLGGGNWHYEYAVRNHNSERAARTFRAFFSQAATLSNAGARFISHHSGEPFSTAPWTLDTSVANEIGWSTEDFATNANANALRWATMFSFWFDATQPPSRLTHMLGFFKPGSPGAVEFLSGLAIFADGFETGDTAAWSLVSP